MTLANSSAKRAKRVLADGSLVALSLLFGTECPRSRVVRFCLAIVPRGYRDVLLPEFTVLFTEAKCSKDAISGNWLLGTGSMAQLKAPLSTVLCSGLEFEPLPSAIVPENMSVEALKAELKCRDKVFTGSKPVLLSRLVESVNVAGPEPRYHGRRLTKNSAVQLRDLGRDFELGLTLYLRKFLKSYPLFVGC